MYQSLTIAVVILLLATLVGYIAELLRQTQWHKTQRRLVQLSSGILGLALAYALAPHYAILFPKLGGDNGPIDDLFSVCLAIVSIVLTIILMAVGALLYDIDASRRTRHG